MRLSSSSSVVFAAGIVLALLACSSSDETPGAPVAPEAGASSSSGSTSGEVDDAGGSTSSSSSGSTTTDADASKPQWVTTTNETMMVDGAQRQYILAVPLTFDATKKYPLYIFMHGNPGSAAQVAGFGLEQVTKDEAIIAYPSSLVTDGWNHSAAVADNADSDFLLALVDELANTKSVDKTKVLLSGWSGGGFMSSSMACRFYDSFKAIGIHAGGAPYLDQGGNPECAGASIPTLVTHGALDNNVGGTSGFYAAEFWRDHNGCDSTTTATTPMPCVTYDNCTAGKPVEYCLRPQGGHELWDQAFVVEWAWFKALP